MFPKSACTMAPIDHVRPWETFELSHFGIPPPFPPFLSARPISIVPAVVATSLRRTFSHHDSSHKFSDWFTLEQMTGHCLVHNCNLRGAASRPFRSLDLSRLRYQNHNVVGTLITTWSISGSGSRTKVLVPPNSCSIVRSSLSLLHTYHLFP